MDEKEPDEPKVVDISEVELKNFRDTAIIYTSICIIIFSISIIIGHTLNTFISYISLPPILQLPLGLATLIILLTVPKSAVSKLRNATDRI